MNAIEQLPRISDEAAASIRAFAPLMSSNGAPLYAELCKRIPDDPEVLGITAYGLASFPAIHLFVAVQYLLMHDPRDPLAQYYASLTATALPPQEAFPDFARFCLKHREEILELMKTRTIQATMPERCQAIMPALSYVSDLAGEPLDLIEIGCSAGLLLTFDQYAYEINGRGRIGPDNAPLTFRMDVRGGPEFRIPKIGKRVGLDLRPVDATSTEERLWLLAQFHPEARNRQLQLATALDVVTRTDIKFFEGDALDLLPVAIANSPGPLCVYHSNCVIYWTEEGKARLEALLQDASRGREIYRVGMEPDTQGQTRSLELVVTRYRHGLSESKVVANTSIDHSTLTWLD